MLCSICTTSFVTGDLELKLRTRMHSPLPHHDTLDTFSKSVEESCMVCTAIWRSIESRGRFMRQGQGPVTRFSLEVRRRALSKSAKVITIYWHEYEERFQQQKRFSLEVARGMLSDCHAVLRNVHFGLTCAAGRRPRMRDRPVSSDHNRP
jgi:hypothetical protein